MPFSPEQFFAVFVSYNKAIWPMQILAYGLGTAILLALLQGGSRGSRAAYLMLALMWAWNGVAYHMVQFAIINTAAYCFGAAFLVQAALFGVAAAGAAPARLSLEQGFHRTLAVGLIAYAMVVYPVLGWITGRSLEASPAFGVAPCPTTIFTLGVLALSQGGPWLRLSAIPLLWAMIGSNAAVLLGVWEDLGLVVAAAAVLTLMVRPSDAQRAPIGRPS